MRVAIIGAAGKTGTRLVNESLKRGHDVLAVCRDSSVDRLNEFKTKDRFSLITAPVVSDEATLTKALVGCDGVVAILIAARRLKATDLVTSLERATAANGVKHLSFTAGEITAVREEGEVFTRRQRLMAAIVPPLMRITPYSVADMLKASVQIRQQPDWEWTIVRAPTLTDKPAVGYRLCEISEITGADTLSRKDYAACLLDCLVEPERYRQTLAVVSAGSV